MMTQTSLVFKRINCADKCRVSVTLTDSFYPPITTKSQKLLI